jgi:Fanconi-associated nuclease 1
LASRADEPKYLLTRLLLRKTNKIFAFSELKLRYSSELGHHLTGAMEELVKPIAMVGEDEQTTHAQGSHGEEATQAGRMNGAFSAEELRRITLPSRAPTPDGSDVQTNADAGPSNRSRVSTPLQDDFAEATSWRDVPSGLPAEEERADPELARAMKMSRWEVIKSERSEKSVSGGASPVAISGSASPAKGKGKDTSAIEEDNFYKMKEGSTDDITSFAHGEDDMRVEEMIKYLGVSELTAIAKDLKCWKSKYTVGAADLSPLAMLTLRRFASSAEISYNRC